MRSICVAKMVTAILMVMSGTSIGYAQSCVVLEQFQCSDFHTIIDGYCFQTDCVYDECPSGAIEKKNVNANSTVSGYRSAYPDEQGTTSYSYTPVVCVEARNCSGCGDFFGSHVCQNGQGNWYDHQIYQNMSPSGSTCWGT